MGTQRQLAEFESLFKQYYPSLCAYACSILGNNTDAEDVVQTLFIKLWVRRSQLSIQHNIKAYLFQATRNNCLLLLRNRTHKLLATNVTHTAVLTESVNAQNNLQASEILTIIRQTYNSLSDRKKEIFSLIRHEGFKYHEAAAMLNISVKTIEKAMGQVLKLFRRNLAEYLTVYWAFYFLNNL